MDFSLTDTIVAVATPLRGGIRGVLRLSGPATLDCLRPAFTGPEGWDQSPTSHCWSGTLQLNPYPATSTAAETSARSVSPTIGLPGTLYVWPTRASFTRQPSAEFHTLGSPPLLEAALETLCRCGARLAQPGEFTLRAFLAGRIDLTQAEAVLGVIDARSDHQLRSALDQLAGGLAKPLHRLRDQLLNLLADLEAGLDFVDEDLAFISPARLLAELTESHAEVDRLATQLSEKQLAADSGTVVLYGRPNVGKSTIWNQLAGEGRAIVSDRPGTTRDYLVARVRHGQIPWVLVDTAGVDTPDQLDAAAHHAQTQTHHVTTRAVLKLLCLDASRPLDDWEVAELRRDDPQRMIVVNKTDCQPLETWRRCTQIDVSPDLAISGLSADAAARIAAAVERRLMSSVPDEPLAAVASTAARCRESLALAAQRLAEAQVWAERRAGDELVAAAVRASIDALGQVLGAVYTDDLLDRIFSRFCIGK